MKQLTNTAPNKVEWLEVPEPTLQDSGEALVRPLIVARCDVDLPIILGVTPFSLPVALGHEFVGEVIETGDAVRTVRAGDRVIVPFQISCGECDRCQRGITGSCSAVGPGAAFGFGARGGDHGGAISDLVRVPFADAMLLPLPDGVSAEAIASADNIPDGYRTVGPHLRETPGAPVLVVGGGAASVGLYAAAVAVALGSSRVDYIDTDATRLDLASSVGANPVQGPPPANAGAYPITVDASASVDGLHCALRSTEPAGVCTSVGIYFNEFTPMPLLEMYRSGITFHTSRANARAVLPDVIDLIQSGRLQPEKLITDRVPWRDAAEEYARPAVKLLVTR